MKEAIEKARAKGLKLPGEEAHSKIKIGSDHIIVIVTNYKNRVTPIDSTFWSLYDLIFSTDFIDRLVGDDRYYCEDGGCCVYDRIYEDLAVTYLERGWGEKSFLSLSKATCGWKSNTECIGYMKRSESLAHDHRQQMANIMDIDKLKEYVRGLV
jgi:hypothetical protein